MALACEDRPCTKGESRLRDQITRSVNTLHTKVELTLRVRGPSPFPVWREARSMQKYWLLFGRQVLSWNLVHQHCQFSSRIHDPSGWCQQIMATMACFLDMVQMTNHGSPVMSFSDAIEEGPKYIRLQWSRVKLAEAQKKQRDQNARETMKKPHPNWQDS